MGGVDPAGRDPGLQPERTRLAWRRTTLSASVAAVLAARTALHAGVTALAVVMGALCAVLWLGFLWVAQRRIHALTVHTRPPVLPPRYATAAVLCTVATAVCAAVLVV
ncbi:DUF202 domain-containing protein [Streptomyces sp. NK08204]|uniref:DUF202 domain-containing protein n=1 Tax=Streptomyces sp. NK08204 TaxID=2873260 RepID=UPI001CED7415|nr:DUF202 domain-containing protein [Streptomyces sp. NK08204]